jgi:hypothetical protein
MKSLFILFLFCFVCSLFISKLLIFFSHSPEMESYTPLTSRWECSTNEDSDGYKSSDQSSACSHYTLPITSDDGDETASSMSESVGYLHPIATPPTINLENQEQEPSQVPMVGVEREQHSTNLDYIAHSVVAAGSNFKPTNVASHDVTKLNDVAESDVTELCGAGIDVIIGCGESDVTLGYDDLTECDGVEYDVESDVEDVNC